MRKVGQLISLAILLAAVVLWATQASGASSGTIKVQTEDGPKKIDVRDSEPDVGKQFDNGTYKIKGSDGTEKPVKVAEGWALGNLLIDNGIPLDSINFIEIPRPSGGVIRLQSSYLGYNRFPKYGPVAVYFVDGRLNFVRPLVNAKDRNAGDVFEVPGGPLLVKAREAGQIFKVTAEADSDEIRKGDSVTYTAEVKNGEGYTLDYKWEFDDGDVEKTTTGSVTHTFETKGDHSVRVTVTTEADPSSGEAVVNASVGGKHDFGDPVDKGDGSDGSSDSGGYSGYDGGYSSGYDGYTPPSDYNTPDYNPPSNYNTPDTKPPKTEEPVEPEPTGTKVSGELLGASATGEAAPPTPADESSSETAQPTPADEIQPERDVPSSVITGMAVIGLLGMGTFTELRGPLTVPGRIRRRLPFRFGRKG